MSEFISPTPPTSPAVGDKWFETSTGRHFVWTINSAAVGVWVQVPPAGTAVLQPPDVVAPLASTVVTTKIPVLTTAALPPTTATPNDLWYDSTSGFMFVLYNDGNTIQWVVTNPGRGSDVPPAAAIPFVKLSQSTGIVLNPDPFSSIGTVAVDEPWLDAKIDAAITGEVGSFTKGSVIFAGTGSVPAQDNANFFWDDTNNRLGIGTAAPGFLLDVQGNVNGNVAVNFANTSTAATATSNVNQNVGGKIVTRSLSYTSNFIAEQSTTGIINRYSDFNFHSWRNNAGSVQATLASNTLTVYGSGAVNNGIVQHDNTNLIVRAANAGGVTLLGGSGANSAYVSNTGTFPTPTKTQILGDAAHVWNAFHTVNSIYYGATSGTTTVVATAAAGATTQTLQALSGTIALTSDITTAVGNYLPLVGGTLTGALTGTAATMSGAITSTGGNITASGGAMLIDRSGDAANAQFLVRTDNAFQASIDFQTGSSERWQIRKSGTAEGGSNAGSDFLINAYDDTGVLLGTAVQIIRSTRATSLSGTLTGTTAAFSGLVTALTPTPSTDNSTKVATTAFVQSALPTALPGPPTGTAGGDLSGTYPNPTAIKASGAFAVTGALTGTAATFSGNVGIGAAPALGSRVYVNGTDQTTVSFDPNGANGATVYVQGTGSAVGTGGAVMFGDSFGPFAAIKGYATSGTGPLGFLSVSLRKLGTDTTFTEVASFAPAGTMSLPNAVISPSSNDATVPTTAWVKANAGGGSASISVGATPPGSPTDGAMWFNSDASNGGGTLYIRYNDGNTTQWVPASPAASATTIPPGSIMDFAGAAAPSGWLLCQGQSLSTTTYAALFAAIAYTYGGSGATFNVPDLRGRVTAGPDAGVGRLTTNTMGSVALAGTGGSEATVLTVAQMPVHNHSYVMDSPGQALMSYAGTSGTTAWVGGNTMIGIGIQIQNTGGNGGHTNMQPTLIMNKIIKT